MKNNELITKEFNGENVGFRLGENGQSEVRINEVAKFCGWVKTASSGNEVVRWSRVNGFLKELSCPQVVTGDFIPEYIMYPLIGKAKNEQATQFMLWVGKVLTEIRQNGAFISKDITEDQEDKLDKYSTTRKIKATFLKCNMENIENEYKDCMVYNKNKDGVYKNNIQKNIISSLEDRKLKLTENGKGSFALVISECIGNIKKKQLETNNKSRGQIIRYLNVEVIGLKEEIKELNPPIEEYTCFNIHPISENYMYQPVSHFQTREPIMARTDTYNTWIKNFPRESAIPKEELNVDWNKPVKVFIKVNCLERFDTTNFIKATNDMIINRVYDEDDKIVVDTKITRNEIVDSYGDGKIYICLKNV
jgi:prophage antirepressor-like protein